jgi:hypothetical protein
MLLIGIHSENQDQIQLYWYLFDCVSEDWMNAIIGSLEYDILDLIMTYVLGLINRIQKDEDVRRVREWWHAGSIGYDVVDQNVDGDGFLIVEREKPDRTIYIRWLVSQFGIRTVREGQYTSIIS